MLLSLDLFILSLTPQIVNTTSKSVEVFIILTQLIPSSLMRSWWQRPQYICNKYSLISPISMMIDLNSSSSYLSASFFNNSCLIGSSTVNLEICSYSCLSSVFFILIYLSRQGQLDFISRSKAFIKLMIMLSHESWQQRRIVRVDFVTVTIDLNLLIKVHNSTLLILLSFHISGFTLLLTIFWRKEAYGTTSLQYKNYSLDWPAPGSF